MVAQGKVSRLVESVLDNPIIVRDIRSRMRGGKGFAAMGAYAVVMTLVLFVAGMIIWSTTAVGPGRMIPSSAKFGLYLFMVLTWAQATVLTLMVPSLISGALTSEIERKTYEMLALTPLSAARIVIGKLLPVLMYVLALLITSLPLSCLCLLFGSISPAEIAVTYVLLAAWVFLLTCAGVFFSSLFKRTGAASAVTFGASLYYFFSSAVSGGILVLGGGFGATTSNALALLNPGWAPFAALDSADVFGVALPLALAALITHLAQGAIMLLLAISHVRYREAEVALPVRLLLLGLTAFQGWISASSMAGMAAATAGAGAPFSAFALASSQLGLIPVAALVATGCFKCPRGTSIFRYAFSGRKTFKTDIGGAIPFMVLWVLVGWGTQALLALHAPSLKYMPSTKGMMDDYLLALVTSLCATVAVCALSILASALVKSRVLAVLIIYAVLLVGSVVIGTLTAVKAAVSRSAFDPTLFTAVLSVVLLVVAVVALWSATPAYNRYGGVQPDYEL